MKRQSSFFEKIIDYNNIRLAFLKAIRGNRSSPSVIRYCKNTDKNLSILRDKLTALDCGWGNYNSFLITDPKLRVISTAPIEQRIMHHAVMNILEPVLDRTQIYNSYACRKGKGTHSAVLYAFNKCKSNSNFLKLDIRKYFDSLDHNVLKSQIRRLIKDNRVLTLFDGIIDSYETLPGKGVPIGNLTSQFFANMYLSCLDHFILEKLRPSAYCRYMDDFVLWADSQGALKKMLEQIDEYLTKELCLLLKPPVFGKTANGLPFLGFLVKDKGIYLMQKSKKRVTEKMLEISSSLYYGAITEEKAAERACSVFAAIKLARTNRFRKKICEKGERLPAPTGCFAAGRGTTTGRTSVQPNGTTTTHRTGTTTLGSGWFAPELCGMQGSRRTNRFPV